MFNWATSQLTKISETLAPPPSTPSHQFLLALSQSDQSTALSLLHSDCLDPHSPLNHRGMSALHVAASHSHVELVEAILQMGVSVDSTDFNGWTGLHHAAAGGALELVRFLVERCHASVLLRTNDGSTAYDVAASQSVRGYLLPRQLQLETKQCLDNGGKGLMPGIDLGGCRVSYNGNVNMAPPPIVGGFDAGAALMQPPPGRNQIPMPTNTGTAAPALKDMQQQQQQQPPPPEQQQHHQAPPKPSPPPRSNNHPYAHRGGNANTASILNESSLGRRIYKPDGFHSSSNDAELQAKYGHVPNQFEAHRRAAVPPPPMSGGAPTMGNPYSAGAVTRGRYPGYCAVTDSVSAPSSRGGPGFSSSVPVYANFHRGGSEVEASLDRDTVGSGSFLGLAPPKNQPVMPAFTSIPAVAATPTSATVPPLEQPNAGSFFGSAPPRNEPALREFTSAPAVTTTPTSATLPPLEQPNAGSFLGSTPPKNQPVMPAFTSIPAVTATPTSATVPHLEQADAGSFFGSAPPNNEPVMPAFTSIPSVTTTPTSATLPPLEQADAGSFFASAPPNNEPVMPAFTSIPSVTATPTSATLPPLEQPNAGSFFGSAPPRNEPALREFTSAPAVAATVPPLEQPDAGSFFGSAPPNNEPALLAFTSIPSVTATPTSATLPPLEQPNAGSFLGSAPPKNQPVMPAFTSIPAVAATPTSATLPPLEQPDAGSFFGSAPPRNQPALREFTSIPSVAATPTSATVPPVMTAPPAATARKSYGGLPPPPVLGTMVSPRTIKSPGGSSLPPPKLSSFVKEEETCAEELADVSLS